MPESKNEFLIRVGVLIVFCGRISFEQFKDWTIHHPMILKYFNESFRQEIWGNYFD